MKQESVIPEFFQSAYQRYLKLQTEEEEIKFWDEVMNDTQISPEVLSEHLKEGLLLLSDQVDSLRQKVKAHLPV